jgi:Type I phosphodiesterase / nucleotide pyrophosphatase
MRARPLERLLICYVPAIDVRAVAAGAFPHVAQLLSTYPSVRFRTQPTTDQLPTLLTGTWPHQHGMWGPRLRPDWRRRTPVQRLVDLLPDTATTTAQCALHVVNGPIDLATMPPRRHRRFDWLRFNIKEIDDIAKVLQPINGLPSICTSVGARRGNYVYHDDFWDLDRLLATVGNGDFVLEMVDVHCVDHLQHWNMGDPERIAGFLRGVDAFVAALHAKSRSKGLGFVVLSDHGMEPVDRVIDLRAAIEALDLSADAYDVFIENTKATLWFHDEAAGARIVDGLQSSDLGTLVNREEMRRYDLLFDDRSYGDAYFYAQPGCTFFPNDFHQPLASLVRTLSDRQQRRRLRVPWHQGDHGYLPDNDCEIGFMVLAEDGYEASAESVALIDIAPTLLDLLLLPRPPSMKGRAALRPRRAHVA